MYIQELNSGPQIWSQKPVLTESSFETSLILNYYITKPMVTHFIVSSLTNGFLFFSICFILFEDFKLDFRNSNSVYLKTQCLILIWHHLLSMFLFCPTILSISALLIECVLFQMKSFLPLHIFFFIPTC